MLNPYAAIRPASRANFLMLDRRTDEERPEVEGGEIRVGRARSYFIFANRPDRRRRPRRAAARLGPLPRDAKAESTGLEDMPIREPKEIAQVLRCL